MRLRNVVNVILETDLPAVEKIEYASIYKLRKMLMIVSSLVPYTPNISTLSGQLEINRASVMKYFIYLFAKSWFSSYVTCRSERDEFNE